MCGIAGMVDFNRNIQEMRNTLTRMVKTLEKRGPDSEGEYYSKNVLLGHRRLIVVDPEGGKQPMIKIVGGKKYVIVYNGELYNTEDLRKELLSENYTFDAVHAVLKHSSCVQKTMTEREAKLLQMLCKKKNELVRRDIILSRLWDTEDDFFASRSLDVFVTRLRKLFADDERIQIKTVKGVGLCLSDKG